MRNDFFMWGERGLVTTFLLDLSSCCSSNILPIFLQEIELADKNRIVFAPQKIWCIIEPDFGKKGFGAPDAIIVFENGLEEKIVIIFEGKRTTYSKSSKNPSRRGVRGFNSSINGQLELNYRLTLALSEFSPANQTLNEQPWISKTRYAKLRKLKNLNVIENVVQPIAGLNLDSYYHIILTTDRTNPLIKNNNLPQLFDKNDYDKWDSFKSNFGWINYEILKNIAENSFKNGKFLDTFKMNLNNMDFTDVSSGYSIIYTPAINPKVLFHFSWVKESGVLRNYKDKFSKPEEIHEYKTSEIRNKIKKEIIPEERRRPVTDRGYWYDYIQKLKKEWQVI